MSVVNITFNIADPNKKLACQDYIKSKVHIEINESSYIVKTTQILEFLRKGIAEFMDKDDKLFITKVRDKDWISFRLGKNKRQWIEDNV
jgi:hypothetical protein